MRFFFSQGTEIIWIYGSHVQSRKLNKSVQEVGAQTFFFFFLLFWRSLIACESLFFSIASTLHFVFASPNITTGSWTEPKKGNRASEYIWKICQDVTPIWWKTDSNRSGPFLGISLSVIKCTELIYTADWRLPLITNTTGAEGAKSSCDLLK